MDQFVWEMCVMPSFELYARVLIAHSLRRNFGAVNGQWVPMREFSHKRESANLHFPYNPIDFASFNFRYCPQFTHPARAPVKQS